MHWPAPIDRTSHLTVLPSLVTLAEVEAILRIIASHGVGFDADPDTVDGMATHEIWVQNGERGIASPGSLKGDADPQVVAARQPMRRPNS